VATFVVQCRDLTRWVRTHFWPLLVITTGGGLVGVAVALLLPVTYRAQAVLLPPGDGGSSRTGLLSQLSALTGVNAMNSLASFGPVIKYKAAIAALACNMAVGAWLLRRVPDHHQKSPR